MAAHYPALKSSAQQSSLIYTTLQKRKWLLAWHVSLYQPNVIDEIANDLEQTVAFILHILSSRLDLLSISGTADRITVANPGKELCPPDWSGIRSISVLYATFDTCPRQNVHCLRSDDYSSACANSISIRCTQHENDAYNPPLHPYRRLQAQASWN
jgi:hypothetical protein